MDDAKKQLLDQLDRAICDESYNMSEAHYKMSCVQSRKYQHNEFCKRTYDYIVKADEYHKKVIDLYNQLCEMEGHDKV